MANILITGASSGIGAALAEAFCTRGGHRNDHRNDHQDNHQGDHRGDQVFGLARRGDRLAELAAAHKGFTPVTADVTDAAAIQKAVDEISTTHGRIDRAILNAGMYIPQDGREIDPAVYRQHMEVNYMGVVNTLAAITPSMVAAGRGHIVIVASVTGWRGLPKAAAYGPTKAALISLAESLAFDLVPAGIKIQVVSPGFVETEATAINDFDMPGLVSASRAAEEIIKGMARDEFEITFPKGFTRMVRLMSLMPWRQYYNIIRKRTST